MALKTKHFVDAPDGYGLCVSLDDSGISRFKFVKDVGLADIHPYIHVPTCLTGVMELSGGGSGATVLKARDEEFGDVVLKHAGSKDTAELFALATLREQLKLRSSLSEKASKAASVMSLRTPDFRFLYISQSHLRDRSTELWRIVKECLLKNPSSPSSTSSPKLADIAEQLLQQSPKRSKHKWRGIRICCCTYEREVADSSFCADEKLACCANNDSKLAVEMKNGRLDINLDVDARLDETESIAGSAPCQGHAYLAKLFKHLGSLQKTHGWKFTLAQEAIGDPSARTGSSLLMTGKLHRDLLESLCNGMLTVMADLQNLTLPNEADIMIQVRQDVAEILARGNPLPSEVSDLTDSYVGFAIRKNFDGRFQLLRDLGSAFRTGSLLLTKAEEDPARHLGSLLTEGTPVEQVFASGLMGTTALDRCFDSAVWRDILVRATSLESAAAVRGVWTCGLSDCGLHNLFLSEFGIWLFDLGEPAIVPLPALLTKFFMSFFHIPGMESADGDGWVNRFEADGKHLRLTEATASLLPIVREAFVISLRRIVSELFNGERAVCELILKYVVLQLLSDAAFCLQRWEMKGGGVKRCSERAQKLEKWLWRALWDVYIASYVADHDWCSEVFLRD
eukprot:TRINITY_DN30811_c0_g1_i1.p1 TRINITY_DN30811_c0_g1~~TRINITY_DN30811_c0_g1_i1.p1  ORF type:complete len:655 (+),score=92.10 TRINITY_DN30811_c0_g1_i1:97-1965(+)